MDSITLFVVLLCGLLLIPILLRLLQQILPLFRTRSAATLPGIAGLMRSAFRVAGHLLTDDGMLSPSRAVAQVAGAALMITAGVIFALCELQFTLATLCPMLGLQCHAEIFAGFDQLLGLSTVLMAVGFGLVLTDLSGWTFVTRFAVAERGRLVAFCIAFTCFVASIVVTVALARYRMEVLRLAEANVPCDPLWLSAGDALFLAAPSLSPG